MVLLPRMGGPAPTALPVFLHGPGLRALAVEHDLLGVRVAEPEGDAMVRLHLRRPNGLRLRRGLRPRRRLGQTRNSGSEEEQQERHAVTFHSSRAVLSRVGASTRKLVIMRPGRSESIQHAASPFTTVPTVKEG